MVRISACHVEGPGSIPGRGENFSISACHVEGPGSIPGRGENFSKGGKSFESTRDTQIVTDGSSQIPATRYI